MTVLLTLLVGLALCALFFGTDSTERPRSPEEELAGLGYSWRDLDDPAEPSSHLPSPVKEHLA